MNDQILNAFKDLEDRKYEFDEKLFPRYSVRLDASHDNEQDRTYRLFVRSAEGAPCEDAEDDLRYLLDVAVQFELTPTIENNGVELTP